MSVFCIFIHHFVLNNFDNSPPNRGSNPNDAAIRKLFRLKFTVLKIGFNGVTYRTITSKVIPIRTE